MEKSFRNLTQFGNWVRQERKRRRWSQADLASRLGIYQEKISQIETGKSNLKLTDLLEIAAVFGKDITISERNMQRHSDIK